MIERQFINNPNEKSETIRRLLTSWTSALKGDELSQAEWRVVDRDKWHWQSDGLTAHGSGDEWLSLAWERATTATFRCLGNFLVEVSVTGKGEAAGISFGRNKDFLTTLDGATGSRRLQLEVDLNTDSWAFRVDGQLITRSSWNSNGLTVRDIVDGKLHLKAKGAECISFHDFQVSQFAAQCRLSVIITCYRFLQRLRVCLRNWCHQGLPSGAVEILVVNPESPDGTHEHLAAVARSYSTLRLRELPVERELAMNKGAMINRAVAASLGEIIWLTDADCLFSPTSAAMVLDRVKGKTQEIFYAERRDLNSGQTARLLSGQIDGLNDFAKLASETDETAAFKAPWGYSQIVHRSILRSFPYREDVNHYASTDNLFVLDCQQKGIQVEPIPGLFCLHLEHPFAWYGAKLFL